MGEVVVEGQDYQDWEVEAEEVADWGYLVKGVEGGEVGCLDLKEVEDLNCLSLTLLRLFLNSFQAFSLHSWILQNLL